MFNSCDDSLVDLLVKPTHHPKQRRDVPVLPLEDLLVADTVPELLVQFFLGEERNELLFGGALLGVAGSAAFAADNAPSYHIRQLAVVRTRAQVAFKPSAAVAVNHLPAVGCYLFQRLESEFGH